MCTWSTAPGDLEISSVSGTLVVTLDSARSLHARTTSGDLRFEGKLTRGASFEASIVSGDLNVRASAEGGYAYEVSTFSGDISDCFDAKRDKSGDRGPFDLRHARRGGRPHAAEDDERRRRALRPQLSLRRWPGSAPTRRRRCAFLAPRPRRGGGG